MFARPQKPKPPPPEPPAKPKASWIVTRQAEVARFFGASLDTVKGWAKQGMPGHVNRYDLQSIVAWLRKEGPWRERAGRQAPQTDEDGLLFSGPATPGLERLRLAKAAIAELELQARRGTLVSVEQTKEIGLRWAVTIKRLGERLGRRYGAEAAQAVSDALEECQRVLDALDAPTPADPDTDPELVDRDRPAKKRKTDQPVGRRRGHRAKRTARRGKV